MSRVKNNKSRILPSISLMKGFAFEYEYGRNERERNFGHKFKVSLLRVSPFFKGKTTLEEFFLKLFPEDVNIFKG